MSFAIRRNVKSNADINHNFHVLDWLLRGNISTENINSVSVDKISGTIRADEVTIGANTFFEEGYDYRGKMTYLNEEGIYTGKIYASQIELGSIGQEEGMTVIRGGYLNTETIEASSITADKLYVNDLTAITANFTQLQSGSPSDYIALYESGGNPYVTFVDSGEIRMGLTSDRMQFFTSLGNYGGTIIAEEDPDWSMPAITMASTFMTRNISLDAFVGFGRSSGMATRVHSGDLELSPSMQMYAMDVFDDGEGYKIDSGAYIQIDAHGDSIASPFGNIDLVGITRIYGINPEDMNRGYKITKNGAGGVGIINFVCL